MAGSPSGGPEEGSGRKSFKWVPRRVVVGSPVGGPNKYRTGRDVWDAVRCSHP